MEALRLRVEDLDFDYGQITVRSGKGEKDRRTVLPRPLAGPLREQLARAKLMHEQDRREGYGAVYLPCALERKSPSAARGGAWQYVFPSACRSADPRSKVMRRHHAPPDSVQREVKGTLRRACSQSPSRLRRRPERPEPQQGGRTVPGGGLKAGLERHHGQNTECAFWGWNRVRLDSAFRSWNIEEYPPRITVPVLVIQGEEDEYGTFRQVEAIERGCAGPVTSVLITECGHNPHQDRPGRTLDEIISFIRTVVRDGVR